jgi:hypothetical protein
LRQDRFGAPSDKRQNEEGGPHQSLPRVLHEKILGLIPRGSTQYARLTMPVADESFARLTDVVGYMRCVPWLDQ